jgi:hypothetical protein
MSNRLRRVFAVTGAKTLLPVDLNCLPLAVKS